ncbi:hypothetical protein DL98DRAFT_508801 [Cadophora sp. DSE1049]|nr:hypothetical protein DL98DRAFT_508801 [Cadophora sp. DSE1049]
MHQGLLTSNTISPRIIFHPPQVGTTGPVPPGRIPLPPSPGMTGTPGIGGNGGKITPSPPPSPLPPLIPPAVFAIPEIRLQNCWTAGKLASTLPEAQKARRSWRVADVDGVGGLTGVGLGTGRMKTSGATRLGRVGVGASWFCGIVSWHFTIVSER